MTTYANAITVHFTPNTGSPAGKLADAELHFADGLLTGLRLIGFAVWEKRNGSARRNVTFPARSYSINGERRSFALLRPISDPTAQESVRTLILDAYARFEAATANPCCTAMEQDGTCREHRHVAYVP